MKRSLVALLLAGVAFAAAAEPMFELKVRPTDNLTTLTRDLMIDGAGWREVARLNRLADPNRIYPGQVLQIPERLMRSRALAATLVAARGEVRVADRPADAGSALAEGQTVSTGEQSSAIVELADGSRVKLGPSTLAEIVASREYALRSNQPPEAEGRFGGLLRLIQGSIEVFATKVLRAKPLEVTTPTAVVGVRGTQYRVGSEAASTHAEVLDGTVHAGSAAGGEAIPLPAGYGVSIDASTRTPTAQVLAPAPDLSGIAPRYERPLVRFALPAGPAHRVQVASDASFDHIVYDAPVAPNAEVRVAGLDDATWYVRAHAVAPDGLGGLDASRSFVLKARPEPPALSAPRPNGKLPAGEVQLGWARNPDAPTYRVQVAPGGAGFDAPLVQRDGLAGAEATLPALPPGRYQWRMAGVRADGDVGPWGDPQSFELRPLPEAPTGGMSGDGRQLTLAWSGRPEDRQQVELARDPAFTQSVIRAELTEPQWTLPRPDQPGTYYFRYRSVEPDGYVSPWSGTLQIEVPRNWRDIWPLFVPALGLLL